MNNEQMDAVPDGTKPPGRSTATDRRASASFGFPAVSDPQRYLAAQHKRYATLNAYALQWNCCASLVGME